MKTFLAGILMLAVAWPTFAESVKYSYDSAGNRIKREIVLTTQKSPKEKIASLESYSEILSEKEIRIYPNPTDGALRVEVIGYEDSDICLMSILNLSGQVILSTHAISSMTDIDLSTQVKGIYILLISLNGRESSWKIIKK